MTTASDTTTTWYTRDATGNVMSVYRLKQDTLAQDELHMYGSSRLGIIKPERYLTLSGQYGDTSGTISLLGTWKGMVFTRGKKFFELTNHLGNVLVTVTDRKQEIAKNDSVIKYYEPDVVTANDYYPFGMLESGRNYNASGVKGYRYGFNGKENDNEVKGEGDQLDYGMRIYDPRLGRFLSVDQLTKKYPELTPYQFCSDRPIDGVDQDGLEYLSAAVSLIKMNVRYVELNNKTYISGGVFLKLDNASKPTNAYIKSGGSNRLAEYEHPLYGDAVTKINKDLALTLPLKTADASDMTAKSLEQPELNILNVPKNKTQARQQDKTKQFFTPSGGGSSPLGDGIVVAVELIGELGERFNNEVVKADFRAARGQIDVVNKVLNKIQFALDNNLIPKAELPNMTQFANYLLDGTEPTKAESIYKSGKWETSIRTDYLMLKGFQDVEQKIAKKIAEINNNQTCTTCKTNNN